MIEVLRTILMILLLPFGLLLIGMILMQESKSGGLSGAFGGGGGADLLGARANKELSRWTGYGMAIFAAILITIGVLCNMGMRETGEGDAGKESPASAAQKEAESGVTAGGPGEEAEETGPAAESGAGSETADSETEDVPGEESPEGNSGENK